MATFSAKHDSTCATCEFWRGPRELDEAGSAAVAEESARGACTLHGRPGEKSATDTCAGWRRWSQLRD